MRNSACLLSALLIALLVIPAMGNEIVVNTFDGDVFLLDVDPRTTLEEIEETVVAMSDGQRQPFIIEFAQKTDRKEWSSLKMGRSPGGYLGYPRNYHLEPTTEEKKDIRFIVIFLAHNNKAPFALLRAKSDLEAAGERIDHIHPLRFLMTVFTDEELKAEILNIRASWVWNHFIGGIRDTLTVETSINNLKDEFIYHFAQSVNIDPNIIMPALSKKNWDAFIELLIKHIPRVGDHDRFDT